MLIEERTTNRHENVTNTHRGETVNRQSGCCLCIALGEQHAPCCGDACRSSKVRASYAPPYCTAEVFDYLLQRRRTFLCAVGVINWDCCMPAPPMSKCSWGRFVPALPEYCWSKCSWGRFVPTLPEYCWVECFLRSRWVREEQLREAFCCGGSSSSRCGCPPART